jgi:predicted nucleotidyltransferase
VDRGKVPREELIEEIRAFMRRVSVEEAIFFGSRQRGDERPHSDLNLVLFDDRFAGRPLSKLLPELQAKWRWDIQVELLPCSREQFDEMQEWNTLAREAAEQGMHITVDLNEPEESD